MSGPVDARELLFPIYAFNIEISRAAWISQEPIIARMRLQWWQDALDEIFTGSNLRRHDGVIGLAQSIHHGGLDRAPFDEMIAARLWDIEREAHPNQQALWDYLGQTSGNLLRLAGTALGADETAAYYRLGQAAGMGQMLLALPVLQDRQVSVLQDATTAMWSELAQEALARFKKERHALRSGQAAVLPALRTVSPAQAVLGRAVAVPSRIAAGRLGASEFSKKMRLLILTMSGRW